MKPKMAVETSNSNQAAGRSRGGKLYVVGTPIGNLADITFRAVETLKQVDVIACEDTRRTQRLLDHYGIATPTLSYHQHNEMTRAPELILRLEEGNQIALVSDAGMPIVSDPGYRLVKLAIRHNFPVVPVPGPCAFVAALSAAGLPVDRFHFAGFLPVKSVARQKALRGLKEVPGTQVFYEAPHRILEMLEDVEKVLANRPVVLAREVTKIHEEFLKGTAAELAARLAAKNIKGEFTVLVGPRDPAHDTVAEVTSAASIRGEVERLKRERSLDDHAALKVVARAMGISKSEAYRRWQAEKEMQE
ncbi:MAG: 16S rRNA (cytidine(1402)-2'-O)-methyltransferase [Terriglobia bacterium]